MAHNLCLCFQAKSLPIRASHANNGGGVIVSFPETRPSNHALREPEGRRDSHAVSGREVRRLRWQARSSPQPDCGGGGARMSSENTQRPCGRETPSNQASPRARETRGETSREVNCGSLYAQGDATMDFIAVHRQLAKMGRRRPTLKSRCRPARKDRARTAFPHKEVWAILRVDNGPFLAPAAHGGITEASKADQHHAPS
jgi:hypothetical protein